MMREKKVHGTPFRFFFLINGFVCMRQYLKKLFDLHTMPRILAIGLWRPLFYGTVRFGKD